MVISVVEDYVEHTSLKGLQHLLFAMPFDVLRWQPPYPL